ncbi:VOC family protein [Sagittula stellata]|uniref:Potential extradiol-cleaving dioxygenase of dihydroxy-substituted aromatic compound n=1 Tax=Sagittula stellata (strain ATCC 700073 / DSM 11524 / E-37) TaxID=388399 RepID=A3K4A7_SAGS3|nr:VOC family protein [Sagittula stellata]EBA07806.1 potential extradiol-cleaving dioxygenase of dihydroxy-substituted aromatic compound [Sagittula stellata E-37]
MTSIPKIKGMYHYSFPCRDGEETRQFYEDLLGLPLVTCMQADKVPSTGEEKPYAHFFFEMGDGSYMAFFDLGENEMPKPSPNTPAWVMHFAMEMDSIEDVLAMRKRLHDAGVEVTDIVDHEFIHSIYFFDPNGLRLEVTTRVEPPSYMEAEKTRAHAGLDAWTKKKKALLAAKG